MNLRNNNDPDPDDFIEYLLLSNSFQYYVDLQQIYLPFRTNQFSFPNAGQINRLNGLEDEINPLMSLIRNRDHPSPRGNQKNNHEKYMKLSATQRPENVLNKQDSHIKVTVIRNMSFPNANNTNEYYINEKGLIGSNKNTDIEDILIGRQFRAPSQDGQSVVPNDIILPETDRVISRIHCKLICQDFFTQKRILKQLYKWCLAQLQLPQHILTKVAQYLESPRDVYIQDLGSVYGTHLRVFRSEPYRLQSGQQYSVGSETNFTILECKDNCVGLDQDLRFLETIKKLNKQKFEIHGLNEEILKEIEIKDEEQLSIEQLLEIIKQYNTPFMAIKFTGGGIEIAKSHNLFICHHPIEQCQEFLIGRGQENHVRINSNTISRKQTRFFYISKQNSWFIADGSNERESANGTWVSLTTAKQKEQKLESDKKVVKNNFEIKISDYILKIELIRKKNHAKLDRESLRQLLE